MAKAWMGSSKGCTKWLMDFGCNYLCSLLMGHGTDAEQFVVG